ncbi:MAG: response regulator [Parvularculaceae bacterium]|nr:response regulator [Parvularculaceae bacterium]
MRNETDPVLARLKRSLAREQRARQSAESLLESKSAALYKALEDLRHESAFSRDISEAADAAADGIALTDAEGIFTYMNHAHAAIFQYEPAELIGQSWSVLYEPHIAQRIGAQAMPIVFSEGSWRGEAVGRRKDASAIVQEIALTARPENQGLICITRDASARKAREARMREMEHQLRVSENSIAYYLLSHTVAHDLANLLAVIEGNSAILAEALGDGELADRVGRIATATNSARDVITSLETGVDHTLRGSAEVDLVQFLRKSISLAESIKPSAVDLKVELPEHAEAITNEVLLSRSVLNIAKNAFEALSDGGHLTIRLIPGGEAEDKPCSLRLGPEGLDPDWVIELIDDGPGFSGDDLQTYFEPFTSTKSKATTSGLGLLSVRALAESRAASVEIYSEAGEGTRYRILLPKNREQPRPYKPTAKPAASARILIVDDEVEIGEVLSAQLKRKGYEASFIGDPTLALEVLLASETIDLVITDLNMPQMAGDTLARRVKAAKPDLPFILVSGQSGFVAETNLFEARLRKPVRPHDLYNAVDQVVRGGAPI